MTSLLTSLPDAFGGPTWLAERRARAAEALRQEGLPTKKTESWRFTPVRGLLNFGDGAGTTRRPTLDGDTVPEGVQVRSIKDVLAGDPDALKPYLAESDEVAHFAALNTAMFDDGVWISVQRGVAVEHPVKLAFGAGETGAVSYPRVLVTLEEGASLTLVETFGGSAGHLTNAVCEFHLGVNSHAKHVRVHQDGGMNIGRVYVDQAASSTYQSTSVALGGGLLRQDLHVALKGPGAECDLRGAYLAGEKEHVDHHTRVEHESAHCTSRQNYRGIVGGEATAVFDGIVVVRRDAQKTEAHQENRNLLLSDTATVHTKPHLEIDADDVVCSHGATIGALDDEQLFYLRSRGIDEPSGRAILTHAFISQIVDAISDDATRNEVAEQVLARIPHGDVVRSAQEERT